MVSMIVKKSDKPGKKFMAIVTGKPFYDNL